MKKLPLTLGLLLAGGAALAQDGGAAAGTAVQAAADAAAAVPVPNKGDTAWMMVSTLLVMVASLAMYQMPTT